MVQGSKHTEESKQKIAEAAKKRFHSQETKDKIRMSIKGKSKPPSFSIIKKFQMKGVPRSQEVKDKISAGVKKYHQRRKAIDTFGYFVDKE